MTTIRQILAKKPAVYSTSPQATVYDALETMADKNVGALLGKSSKETPVSEVMTPKVVYIASGE